MQKEFCPCCGQSIMKHAHRMTKSLANVLFIVPLDKPFHLQRDVNLTKNQYTNFHKLKYFGIAERCLNNKKAGYWKITEYGKRFIFNEIVVPIHVTTFNNKVVEVSVDKITIRQATGQWLKREDYIESMRPAFTNTLFDL